MTGKYPNVRARLRRTRHAPGTPPAHALLVIWLQGHRFRVRDETGRSYDDIVRDVTEERGFGATPHSAEDFMDAWDAARAPAGRPTDVYGNHETGEAVIQEAGREPWTSDADLIEAVAEQMLSDGREATIDPVGESTILNRRCLEYRYAVEGDEDGIGYCSQIRLLISTPFVLLREVRDSRHRDLYAVTEVFELQEGVVTEADLTP